MQVKGGIFLPFYLFTFLLFLASCSMTKNIPEDDQLFVGLTKIAYSDEQKYTNEEYDKHLENTKLEVEAALATQPNGSLFIGLMLSVRRLSRGAVSDVRGAIVGRGSFFQKVRISSRLLSLLRHTKPIPYSPVYPSSQS